MDQVNQVLWDKNLFKHIEDVDHLYSYVHGMLDRAHSEEERNHRDLSADPVPWLLSILIVLGYPWSLKPPHFQCETRAKTF